jgi:hypothetical protein
VRPKSIIQRVGVTERYAGVADADFFLAVPGGDLDGRALEALIREK